MEPRSDQLTTAAVVFISYLVAANISHSLHLTTAPTLLWPAAGIALVACYFAGIEALFAIAAAEFVFSFFVSGNTLFLAAMLAAADTLQAGIGAYVLKRFSFHTGLSRLRDACLIVGIALVTAFIAPTIGSAAMVFAGSSAAFVRAGFGNWYVANVLPLLVLAPLLLRWLPKPTFKRSERAWLEIGVSVGSAVVLSILIFFTPYADVGIPLIYILLMPLFWIALRLGSRIMTLTLGLIDLLAITGTLMRASATQLAAQLYGVELFIAVLAVIFLVLVSIAEERTDATQTLRKQLTRLESALDQIRAEDQKKNDFIGLLAHELRNPLAPLLSSLELMRLEQPENSPMKTSINSMRGRVRTMARLLDDLLDLSRIEHQTLRLAPERFDLVAVVKRALETTEPLFTKKRQTLAVSLPTESLELVADPLRIEQILVNLLTNANKYTLEEGMVSLGLSATENEAVLAVSDTGVGIVRGMLPKIFEPFRQGEAGRRAGGLGIGLALSKNLVEMHGGTIEAKSEGTGHGSSFLVRLPLAKESTGARLPHTERERQLKKLTPSKPLSVLLVDDNRAAADSLAALLAKIGHKPQTAYDGTSGIEKALAGTFAAVILDIGLPDMTGYEAAKQLRERGLTAPLIALTGYGQEDDKREAQEAGFAYHLTKPVSIVDIEKILREIAQEKRKKTKKKS